MTSTTLDQLAGVVGDRSLKDPCRVVAEDPISLIGLLTIDGVTLVQGDRVLVAGQDDATLNGIYDVNGQGAWSLAADFTSPQNVARGSLVFVTDGTVNATTIWRVIATNPVQPQYPSGASAILIEQLSFSGPTPPPPTPVNSRPITQPQQMTIQTVDQGSAPGEYLAIKYSTIVQGTKFPVQIGSTGTVLVDPDNYDLTYTNITNGIVIFDLRFARLGSSYTFVNRTNATSYIYCGDQNSISVKGSGVTMIGIGPGETITVIRSGLAVFSVKSQSNVYDDDNVGSTLIWQQMPGGNYIMYGGPVGISGSSSAVVSFSATPFANSTGWRAIISYNTGTGISSGQDVKNMYVNQTQGTGAQFEVFNGSPNGTTHFNWLVLGLVPAS